MSQLETWKLQKEKLNGKYKYAIKANIQKIHHVERLKGKNSKFIYIHSK